MTEASSIGEAAEISEIPDLREALQSIMPAYWRRVTATLDGEKEAEVISASHRELDRQFTAEVAQAQADSSFDSDPLQHIDLPPELSVAVDALSQRAARQWHITLGYPATIVVFVCRSFLRNLCANIGVGKQIQLGLLKIFGRLVIDELGPTLASQQGSKQDAEALENPKRVLSVSLTMLQNELVQALHSGHPAPPCGTLNELLDSLGQRVLHVTGQRVEVAELAPDVLARLSALFAPILDDEKLDPSSRHMLAALMLPCFKLGLDDPSTLSQTGRPAYDLVQELHQRASLVSQGSEAHRQLLQTIQTTLEDFRDDDRGFVTTLVTLKSSNARTRRRAEFGQRQSLRVAEGKVRLEQAQNQAQLAVAEKLVSANGELPPLLQRVLDVDWVNWLTLILLRHGDNSTQWQENLAFVEDLIWSGEPKQSIADVARLQSMLPQLSGLLHEGLEMVAYSDDQRKAFVKELRTTYQKLVKREYRPQLHIPAVHARFKPRPAMLPIRLNVRDQQAVSMMIRRLKAGTWFEFLTDDGSFIRAKLSWVSPFSDRFLFVDNDGLKLADKTQRELRDEVERGSARILSQPA